MDSPLKEFMTIQNMQFDLDRLKQERMRINKRIKSLEFKIPEAIRGMKLK